MSWPSGVQQLTTINGNEQVTLANASPLFLQATVAAISVFGNAQLYTNGQTAAATLTALQMIGNPSNTSVVGPPQQAFMLCNGSTSGSTTFTTPTVAAMVAAFPNWLVGSSYEFDIINAATGNNVVLGAGTGVTISGTATVSNNTWRKYLVTLTSATAITITMLEVGTYS